MPITPPGFAPYTCILPPAYANVLARQASAPTTAPTTPATASLPALPASTTAPVAAAGAGAIVPIPVGPVGC